MGRRAKPAKIKAEAKRPLARKAPKKEAPRIHELEKRLAEALEQQTATAEILKVISSSPTDIQPVLDAVAESAARLCGANDVIIRRVDGDVLRIAAHVGSVPVVEKSVAITHGTVGGCAALERKTIHVHDIAAEQERGHYLENLTVFQGLPIRTILCAPLLREDKCIGTIAMRRPDVNPFSDKQVKLLETFAAQAVIAIENVRLFNETKEALEQQTATAEILRVISSSPTDIQPVLDAVAESAARLCGASDVVIRQVDGDAMRAVAHFGSLPVLTEALAITRGSPGGRATLERRTIHIHDVLEPRVREEYPKAGFSRQPGHYRTMLVAPLLREDTEIGAITIRRSEVRPFSDQQIKLLETFAAQAVIAIENVRLFNETKEALEQQTATAEILRVISSSPTDVQPVFDAVVQSAARLCEATNASLHRVEGDVMRHVANYGGITTLRLGETRAITRGSLSGRAISGREIVHVHDALAVVETEFPDSRLAIERQGIRTAMAVPLLRGEIVLGAIVVRRAEVRPFAEKQIALLKTFADQAVIAIENVRLFNETKEALEQQTATADILRVISSSPTDIQPVFDAILENATRLCGAHMGILGLYEGEKYHRVAQRGASTEFARWLAEEGPKYPPDAHGMVKQMITERRPIHILDRREQRAYRERNPSTVALVELGGARSSLVVPMLKEGRVVGGIVIYRPEVRPFTQKQIDLVSTFANQAVIAIENVRLFNETKEALEQQTATAEILRVISSSPTDIQPVLDAVAESAARLCGASDAVIRRVDGDVVRLVAHHGAVPVHTDGQVRPLAAQTITSRAIRERRTIHVHDMSEPRVSEEYPDVPSLRQGRRAWSGTLLVVPLLREDTAIGSIAIRRPEVHPFSDKQIKLLETFAAQAVIAIENVRLFNETKEALEQQTATAEILRVISSSPTDIQPVLDAVASTAARLCGASDSLIFRIDGDVLRISARHGSIPSISAGEGISVDRDSVAGRTVVDRQTIHIHDIAAVDETEFPVSRALAIQHGHRTLLATPLLREGQPVGTILIRRLEVRPFSDQQIKLLQTFADQAVIAIENVRLFKELQARNAEIMESLEQQTATADILRVISSSPTDLQPVFDAILEKAIRLCDAHMGVLGLYDGETFHRVAQRGVSAEFARWIAGEGKTSQPTPDGGVGRMIAERRPIHIADRRDSPTYRDRKPSTVALVELGGARTFIAVPMLKEGRVVGGIAIYRPEVRPFTQKQIDLVSTFANQAVIAIENVRLFNETKEALEQQTVISEILRVISSSPTDAQPVFDAIVKSGLHFFGGMNVSLRLIKGNHIETAASTLPVENTGGVFPVALDDPSTPASRAVLRREVVQIPDILAPDDWVSPRARQRAENRGWRSMMAAPLLREKDALGVVSVSRVTPGRFTDKQVALLQTFADQAVIAIENVRLFKELQARNAEITEALDQQTATSEILRVISSSPTNLQPVFDAILEHATRLCDGHVASLGLYDGEKYQHVAQRGANPAFVKHLFRGPFHPDSTPIIGRMVAERRAIHVPDLSAIPQYRERIPAVVATLEQGGARSVLAVPMIKEGRVVGGIFIFRSEARPFTEKQIDLVSTFASQAVIAIENVRLFNEINEALQRQTSIAEILRVISSSPTDVMPVLEAVTHRAAQLCDAPDARLFLVDGDTLTYVTGFGELKGVVETFPLTRGIVTGRAIIDQSVVHIEDVAAAFDEFPEARGPQRKFGHRTTLAVPLVRENKAFGAILMRRKEVRPFSAKQIELVKTFADQAVIAIENVRLFNEIQDKSRQLEVASRHKSQFLANMSHELRTPLNAVLGYTELILDGIYGDVSEKVRDVMGRVDKSGRHLLGLINDVLDLSKIEAGQLTLALVDYSLTDVVQTVCTGVESLAAEKKLALKVALASDLPRGRGDDRRLAQVLLNLVGNAIKFTEAGEVRLEARCADGAFVVSVADTGPGISEADQQRIFEEFQQVDDSATRKKGGTGLGLAIAKRIIELHGGRIRVESAPGRGATFTVTLPVRVERQAGPS